MSDKPPSSIRLIIMAKAPKAGFAKTRLIPVLGADGAATLAREFLLRTIDIAMSANIGNVELCVTPSIDDVGWQSMPLHQDITVSTQCEGDLGQRMANACMRYLEQRVPVILIGTDCIDLSVELLKEAADILNKCMNVIYPTADGGYALLGLTHSDLTHITSRVFTAVPWSTDQVGKLTIDRLIEQKTALFIGRTLHDVDTPADLRLLKNPTLFDMLFSGKRDNFQ